MVAWVVRSGRETVAPGRERGDFGRDFRRFLVVVILSYLAHTDITDL